MKRALFLIFFLFFSKVLFAYTPVAGDIVFQTSKSTQSKAIQIATNSPYSHMGIVLFKDNKPYIFEVAKTVRYTPLKEWFARGEEGHYVVKRLKDRELSRSEVNHLHQNAALYLGKNYDLFFEWSDEHMYCSELVWKLYQSALGIELAPLSRLSTFNLNHPLVQAKLKERYGDKIPLNAKVIAPSAIFDSHLLTLADILYTKTPH